MANIRRSWDKEYYKEKALERIEKGENYEEEEKNAADKRRNREEFKAAPEGAAGPMGSARAFLSARTESLGLDSKVGKTEVVKPVASNAAGGAGWFCEVCKCTLKDSAAYLDHINGKKHQRALGFSMRVERAGVSQVKSKLESLKRKSPDEDIPPARSSSSSSSSTSSSSSSSSAAGDAAGDAAMAKHNERVESVVAEVERQKRAKKEREAALRREREAAAAETMDPEMAAVMGFAGFK